MVDTHCLPTGSLGAGQIPCPNFPGPSRVLNVTSGSRRGVLVMLHGLGGSLQYPYPLSDITGFVNTLYLTLAQDLQAEGWVVVFADEPGDASGLGQEGAVSADFANDAGHGSRVAATTGWLGTHAGLSLAKNYPGVPAGLLGISWGGFNALQMLSQFPSLWSIYCLHVPALTPWTVQVSGLSWDGSPNVTGQIAASMSGVTLPQAIITLRASTSTFAASGQLVIGATTPQIVYYTGLSGSTFTGCTGGDSATTLAGTETVTQSSYTSGCDNSISTLASLPNGAQGRLMPGFVGWETGDVIVGFGATQAMFNAANAASQPVTSYAGTGVHGLSSTDVTNIMNWFTSSTIRADFPAVH
jgi:pimeloyl-ACP methyl ester carboxylesterase